MLVLAGSGEGGLTPVKRGLAVSWPIRPSPTGMGGGAPSGSGGACFGNRLFIGGIVQEEKSLYAIT